MSAVELFDFRGKDVRAVMLDDEPWFVAADVAKILSYRAASDMTRVLDEDEKGTHEVRTLGGRQTVAVISLPGLTRTINMRQAGAVKDPDAKRFVKDFQRWVNHEVLPAIFKTGRYETLAAPSTEIALPQDYASALRALADQVEETQRTRAALEAVAPKAQAYEDLAALKGDLAIGEAAKMLVRAGVDTGQNRLFKTLASDGLKWLYRLRVDGSRSGRTEWRAYQPIIERGWLSHLFDTYPDPKTGEPVVTCQVRVTPKGLERLHRLLAPQTPVVAAGRAAAATGPTVYDLDAAHAVDEAARLAVVR